VFVGHGERRDIQDWIVEPCGRRHMLDVLKSVAKSTNAGFGLPSLVATVLAELIPERASLRPVNPTSALFVTTGAKFAPGGVLAGSYVVDFV
jgi:hypothetical protein